MEQAAPDKKPTIRQIARYFRIGRSGVIKSLGGWKGIQRNRPDPPPKFLFPRPILENPTVKLEQFTTTYDKKI